MGCILPFATFVTNQKWNQISRAWEPFKYLLRALIGSFNYLCFFLWLASVVAIVLLDWNHPSSFTKGKYFPRSYKSSRRNNRKKKIKARMRIKDSQTPVHSVPPYHVVKSQQNLHRLISAYLANLVTTSVNQHSFVTISATQPCKSCIRLTIPNSKVTVLF